MGLFNSKTCSFCGRSFGLFGGTSLPDGFICSTCRNQLSPFVSGLKRTPVAKVKEHLAYRAANAERLNSFVPTTILGMDTKVYYDDAQKAFFVSSMPDWKNGNPDIISVSQITSCAFSVDEYERDDTYTCSFRFDITVNSPYFPTVSFRLHPRTEITGRDSVEYRNAEYICRQIQHLLRPDLYPAPTLPVEPLAVSDNSWTCSCGQTGNTGNFCSACGAPYDNSWTCPSCGNTGNTGRFCTGCGREQPVNWICPSCGTANSGKFCSECGTASPVGVVRTI